MMLRLDFWCLFLGTLFTVITYGPANVESALSLKDKHNNGKRTALFRALEAKFLHKLGFKTRPRPERSSRQQVPRYMIDLYHSQYEDQDWLSTDLQFKSHSKHIPSVNTVRSWFHEDHEVTKFAENSNKRRYVFNVSTMPSHETVRSAELRLYRKTVDSLSAQESKNALHRVNVYEVLKPLSHSTNDYDKEITRLIESRVVDLRTSGWESFAVGDAIHNSLANNSRDFKLEVSVETLDGDVSPRVHVYLDKEHSTEEKWHEQRPLLVAYTHDPIHHLPRSRRKRSVYSDEGYTRKHKRKRNVKENCRRYPLYVNFSDVQWNDWIVAPPGYQAFFCKGECPFPLPEHLNNTNHAIVQTLVNSVNPDAVPSACCVPTSLSTISMLYMDENDKVVLKNYEDMMVEGCGCR